MGYGERPEMPPCRRISRKPCRKAVIKLLEKNGIFLIMVAFVLILNLRYELFYIKTGSMEPALPVGSIVMADPCAEPKVGDIFAYKAGEKVIIHRIVEADGEIYTFRGDANGSNDAAQIRRNQLVGKIVLTLDFFAPIIKMLGFTGR